MKKQQWYLLMGLIFYIVILSTPILVYVGSPSSELLQIITSLCSTFPLVLVTVWYAYDTHRIVDEAQKDREVRLIERRLERLYYPLRNVIIDCLEGAKCFHDQSKPYRNMLYLASEELRKVCDEVYESADYMVLNMDGKFEMDRKVIKIEKLLKQEIDILSTRLKELTTFKTKGQAEIEGSKEG